MTGILKDLMTERADALDTPHLDLATITRAGERRVRRRRTALVGAVATVTVVGALAGNALLSGGDGRAGRGDVAVDGSNASPQPLSWASGSTVHRAGLPDIELAAEVRSWLWVGPSIAWTDVDRRVHLWSEGEDEVIGTVAPVDYGDVETELVTDAGRVGWLDREAGFVVQDVATGERTALPLDPADGDRTLPRLSALDGSTAYGVDGRGVFEWDLDSSRVGVLAADPSLVVLDAANGVLLQKIEGKGVVTDTNGQQVRFALDSFANLSPDGRVVTAESNDVGILVDTTTGERLGYDTGRDWSLPFQWLDDDTVAVLTMDPVEGEAEDAADTVLTTCTVSTGSCDQDGVVVDAFRMELPIGIHFGDR